MRKTILTISTAFIAFSALPNDSFAQAVCGDRSAFVKKLKNGYEEKPVSLGLASNGSVIEVFASKKGTFSIVVTQPGGISCVVAAGDSWQSTSKQKTETKI